MPAARCAFAPRAWAPVTATAREHASAPPASGRQYCHLIAPDYLKRILTGEVQLPKGEFPGRRADRQPVAAAPATAAKLAARADRHRALFRVPKNWRTR